jgi:hypothetical protein
VNGVVSSEQRPQKATFPLVNGIPEIAGNLENTAER